MARAIRTLCGVRVRCGGAIKHLPPHLRSDIDIVCAAIGEYNGAAEFVHWDGFSAASATECLIAVTERGFAYFLGMCLDRFRLVIGDRYNVACLGALFVAQSKGYSACESEVLTALEVRARSAVRM